MLYINVPYAEKDEAKALGAKWNPDKKTWYVEKREDYKKFAKWIVGDREDVVNIICDHFYVVEAKRNCYKCGKITRVIGFAVSDFFDITNDYGNFTFDFYENDFCIQSTLEFIHQNFLLYLKENYNYYPSFSKKISREYFANHCDYCKSLQGEFPLFCEPSSPFFVDNIEKAKNLKLYKFKLSHDVIIYDGLSYSSEEKSNLIKMYSRFFSILQDGIYSALEDVFLEETNDEFRVTISSLKSGEVMLSSRNLIGTDLTEVDLEEIEEI